MPDPLESIEEHRKEMVQLGCYQYDRRQSYCFGPSPINCKVAALLFDRIYVDAFDYQQLNLLKRDTLDDNVYVHSPINPEALVNELAPTQVIFLNDTLTTYTSLALFDGRGRFSASEEDVDKFYSTDFIVGAKDQGYHLMPVLQSRITTKEENTVGDAEAWRVILERTPLIDTSLASWEQILEFRQDSHRVQKLRGIRKLHRKLASVDSENEATDILENALETYEAVSTTHGFQLRRGTLEVLLDKHTILSAGIVGALVGQVDIAVGAGVITALGNVALKVQDTRYKKSHTLLTEEGEAALIYDMIDKFDKRNS